MVSTSGARLLPETAIDVLIDNLLPFTNLLTPNIPEALLLLQKRGIEPGEIKNITDLEQLAYQVRGLGPGAVLIKGGHIPLTKDYRVATTEAEKQIVVNILYDGGNKFHRFESPYQISRNTHGTGCSLASAIACNISSGQSLPAAVAAATRYIEAGIRTSQPLGHGSGPINHFHSLIAMPFPPGNFIDYLLSRPDVAPIWQNFIHHDFVNRLGDGTLDIQRFKFYMTQDYLYLLQFARANALAAYKAKTMDQVAASAAIVLHIQRETQLHIRECEELGLSLRQMQETEEHVACTAYSRYILDVGQSEDWFALQIALLPCLLGYSVIAKRLHALQDNTKKAPGRGNRYLKWIENYVAEDYSEAVEKGMGMFSSSLP